MRRILNQGRDQFGIYRVRNGDECLTVTMAVGNGKKGLD